MSKNDTKKTSAEMVVQLGDEVQTALKEGRWADAEGLDNQLHAYQRKAEMDALKEERDAALKRVTELEGELSQAIVDMNLAALAANESKEQAAELQSQRQEE